MSTSPGASTNWGASDAHDDRLPDILRHSSPRVVFGAGTLSRLGEIARAEGASRVLLVSDPGIVRAGHVQRGVASLRDAGLTVFVFDGVAENPTTKHVEQGAALAREHAVDFLVGLGGGSSMDCAKGVNFLFSSGGTMSDYRGRNKTASPMLPMIAVPTTAGTGSEAQSFALISDPVTHQKMACGDRQVLCRVAILDPDLTATQPPEVAAAAGIDAVAHAVETAATTERHDVSLAFTRQAWARLEASFETALHRPDDQTARANMLLGAHLAGAAIERSMLGAAHACANPLTAHCGVVHGRAVGMMLPHVIRFNARDGLNPYAVLCTDPEQLASRVEALLEAGSLPRCLSECGVSEEMLPRLAEEAAGQWTARFNPRPVTAEDMLEIYRRAWR